MWCCVLLFVYRYLLTVYSQFVYHILCDTTAFSIGPELIKYMNIKENWYRIRGQRVHSKSLQSGEQEDLIAAHSKLENSEKKKGIVDNGCSFKGSLLASKVLESYCCKFILEGRSENHFHRRWQHWKIPLPKQIPSCKCRILSSFLFLTSLVPFGLWANWTVSRQIS